MTRSFLKIFDEFRSLPKNSEVFRNVRSPSLSINASSLPLLFASKIRDREKGIVIYSFYTWFSFLTWVWVDIFFEIVSSKKATTHIFQSGVRNWPAGVSRREIEVFNPHAWDSRLRRESWQVYTRYYFEIVRSGQRSRVFELATTTVQLIVRGGYLQNIHESHNTVVNFWVI